MERHPARLSEDLIGLKSAIFPKNSGARQERTPLTREQLQATRAERWRQNGEALLTLEAAREWLQETGICLFLPRKMQLPAPAPSFVEACLGTPNATPPREAIEAATELLARLIDAGDVIALNLLGMVGEQPDFLVTPEFLPYVFALRGDRDWKHDPATTGTGRVSPLVLEVWKTIERTGVQTAIEIREALGKELTEAAVLRALNELWSGMRVILLPGASGEPATWEALKTRHQKALAGGTATSLVTALSVLLARYLQSSVAATSEEAEVFLSPLASRSKVREVIRGLSATRQLATYSLDAQPLLYVEGTLPEFEEPVAAEEPAPQPAVEGAASGEAGSRIRIYTRRPVTGPDPLRWKRDSSVPPPPGARRSSMGDTAREESRGSRPEGEKFAARRGPGSGPGSGRGPGRAPGGMPRREGAGAPRRAGAEGERKQWTPREGGFSRPAGRPAGKFAPRQQEGGAPAEGRRPSFGARPGSSRFSGARPSSARPSFGGARPGSARPGNARPGGARPSFGAARPGSARPSFGSRPPAAGGFGARPSGPRATGRPGGSPGGRTFSKSAEPGEKRRFAPAGRGPGMDRPGGRPSSRPGGRPSFGSAGRPAGDRPSYPKSAGGKFGPRRTPGAVAGEGAGSAKKGRWVPRTGAGDGREERPARREGGFAGASGRGPSRSGGPKTSFGSRGSRPPAGGTRPGTRFGAKPGARPGTGPSRGAGASRPYAKPGGGKFAPRREGGGAARPSYTKPWAEGRERPARPRSFGTGPESGGSRPEGGFERRRPAGGEGERRPRTFGARPPAGKSGGKAGFKPRPGGRTPGGKTAGGRPGGFGTKKRGPGDYPPRKKRTE